MTDAARSANGSQTYAAMQRSGGRALAKLAKDITAVYPTVQSSLGYGRRFSIQRRPD